jgi:hypothetical protein
MARRWVISFGALLAVLGGIGLLAAISSKGPGPQGPWEPSDAGAPSEPEVILRNVEMREIRNEGTQYRLFSDQATYLLLAGRFSATGVILVLPGGVGEVVVRAPKASWDMQNGQIFLPEGGSAENDTGWSAAISTANLSLPERILTATGKAKLSGPGLSVVGDNLVWHWREGKVSLEMPKARLEPALAFRRRG